MRTVLRNSIVVLAILLALLAGAVATGFVGHPMRYEIAEPFKGWVTVIYENPACKPIEKDSLFLVIHVDGQGKACSSSPMPGGWRYTKFVYVDKDNKQIPLEWSKDDSNMIWAWSNRTPQGGYQSFADIFFVGTSKELRNAWANQPK